MCVPIVQISSGAQRGEVRAVGGPGREWRVLAPARPLCLALSAASCLPPAELLSRGPTLHALHGLHDPHCQRSQFTRKIGEWGSTPSGGMREYSLQRAHLICSPPGPSNAVCRALINPHFRDEKIEAQRSRTTCSGSPSQHRVRPRPDKDLGEGEDNVDFPSLSGSISQPPAFPSLAPLLVSALIS